MRQEQIRPQRQRNKREGDAEPEGTFPDLSYYDQRVSDETADILDKIDRALGEHGTRAASQ